MSKLDIEKTRWVDLQVNGYNGVDFSSPTLTEADVARCAEEIAAVGTATFLPTLVTNAPAIYERNLPIIQQAVTRYGLEHNIPGVHLEGPFITSQGSHDPKLLQAYTPESLARLLGYAPGLVRLMTFSADLPGAPEILAQLKAAGVVPSAGHHMAGYEAVHRVADAGCQLLTHLGNGCPNLIGRHENPLLAGLAEERLTAMIITDGHHLPADLVKLIIRVKGVDKIVVTSDGCQASGWKPGEYDIWGNHAVLEPTGRLYNPEKKCLVASIATMVPCMKFLQKLAILTDDQLLQVGRLNPLRLLGLPEDF